jgi:predicted nuclease of predicted toxin-antitoxin system
MRFLIDAQLSRRLSLRLRALHHDALHTLDLPQGNRTPDSEIARLSVADQRVVVTKDTDFVDSLIVHGLPYKLLLISTGNLKNSAFEALFFENLDALISGFEKFQFIEIDREAIRYHF